MPKAKRIKRKIYDSHKGDLDIILQILKLSLFYKKEKRRYENIVRWETQKIKKVQIDTRSRWSSVILHFSSNKIHRFRINTLRRAELVEIIKQLENSLEEARKKSEIYLIYQTNAEKYPYRVYRLYPDLNYKEYLFSRKRSTNIFITISNLLKKN